MRPTEELYNFAHSVLNDNWRDGFSVPSSNLYPFQWNWDSGFVSLGHADKNLKRAIEELDTLLSGQWENGMIPHILFHDESAESYFPNHDFWNSQSNPGAPERPKSSGITQPAVHGFILEELLKIHPDNPELIAFAKEAFPKIVSYHRFLYTYRDPNREGLMFIFHPWESGRDNSPLWDESLDRILIDPNKLPKYTRKDTSIANPEERPTQAQYDRYVYLLNLGKKYQYDGREIAEESPFLVQDDMMNAILIHSNASLVRIGERFGLDTGEIKEWQSQSMSAYEEKMWCEELNMYCSFDFRAEKQMKHKEIGSYIALYAEIPDEHKAALLHRQLHELHERNYYLCPSFDVDSPLFDSKRYWRGPIWPHMNWMIHHGLNKYGFHETAGIVKEDTLALIERLGFYEYYEPSKSLAELLTKGYGGEHFSWTASTIIDFIRRP